MSLFFSAISFILQQRYYLMNPLDAQVYRLAQQISLKVNGIDEVMSTRQLAEMGSAFKKNL